MPASVLHVFSNAIADGTNTQIVRPSDWNSAHAVSFNVSATEISGLFSNANGVSFGLSDSSITASYTQSTHAHSSLSFSNLNGVSFGVNASTLTASVETNYAGVGETVGTVAGTDLALTVNTDGVSIAYPKWITTAQPVGNYLTTARGSTDAVGLNTALTANGVSWTVNSSGISLNVPAFLTTARGSTDAIGLNTAQSNVTWTVNSSGLSFNAAGYAGTGTSMTNASATLNSNGLQLSVAAPGGAATYSFCYEPFDMQDGTATMTCSLSQLHVQPFLLSNNISFGQINFIGIATMPATSASNSHSARLTNSTQRYTFGSSYTIGNTNFHDYFLFSRGAGVSTSELQTFASTRNSFATNYQITYNGGCTLTNASGGSVSGSQTVSMTISYPFLTSYTSTSVNPASSYTGYSSGYTTWTSAANNNSTFTISTSAARTLSIGSTYPATVGWSGAKRINMNFATSLSAGEYWLGCLRQSSSSGSSSTADAFTGGAGTGNSYSATFNSTAYANTMVLTFVGKTATVINSLGSLGFVTTANMGVEPGLGSFSGTWASNTAYLNNMGNPAGAIALTQILSEASMFRSWFQLASNMPV